MFVDHAEIYVRGGDGGHGCLSFRRERFQPKGGPDGGNGGRGGSVILVADDSIETLLDFAGKHHWIAGNGCPGEGSDRTGADSDDVEIRLPPGTLVYDRDTGILLKDLTRVGERVSIASGGRGGRGNKSFATPTEQTPRHAERGEAADERWLRLELKLIADVGLVGMPNAGKSTLLAALSRATPKIAPYPFTTLKPQLGIVELPGFRRVVLADIPGLIQGAHEGAGLGDAFLRHIERTRVIAHIVDICPLGGLPGPHDAYTIIRGELSKFSPVLSQKPEMIIANKMDLTDSDEALQRFEERVGVPVWPVSAAARRGLNTLAESLWQRVQESKSNADPVADETLKPTGTNITP